MEWGVIVSLSVFIVTHLCITVWWASRVNTMLDFVQSGLKDLVTELKVIKEVYVKKEDVTREIAIIEKEQKAMWRKLDRLPQTTTTERGDL